MWDMSADFWIMAFALGTAHSVIIGWLVFWMMRRSESSKAEIVTFYSQQHSDVRSTISQYLEGEVELRESLMKQCRMMLEHAAAMHQGQALTSNEVLKHMIQSQNTGVVKLMSTVLAGAQQSGPVGGEAPTASLTDRPFIMEDDIEEMMKIRSTVPSVEVP